MHMSTYETLQASHHKLGIQLESAENELARRYASIGKLHDVAKMNRLIERIASIKSRLNSIERMMVIE